MFEAVKKVLKQECADESGIPKFVLKEKGFDNQEIDIVALVHWMESELGVDMEISTQATLRIANSVKILSMNMSMDCEQKLLQLRTDENAGEIVLWKIEELFTKGQISSDKYNILLDYFNNKIIRMTEEQKRIIEKG